MAKVQLIQEWNDIVEYKISENDLIKPSQEFFFKALESLLRSLNVNVDYMKANSPEGDEERTFKIRFCKYINRLYKLYDPANNFYYMDLIQPTAKKCLHVLKMLLNYLKFYNMSKKNIIAKATEHLVRYNEALRATNDLETKIEKNKIRAQKIEHDLRDYETKMPQIKNNIEELSARDKEINSNYASKENDIEKAEKVLEDLKICENALNQQMVNENEYENCLRDIEKTEKELANLNQVIEHSKTSNMDTCRAINEMEQILSEIVPLVNDKDVPQLEEMVRLEESLAKLNDDIVAKLTQIKDITDSVESVTVERRNMEENLKQNENNCKMVDISAKTKTADLEKKIRNMQEQLKALQIQRTNAEDNLHEEEETREFLIQTFDNVLRQIAATFDAD